MAKIYNEVLLWDSGTGFNFSSTSYATGSRKTYWDATKFTGVTTYYEIIFKTSSTATTAYVDLYDVTSSAQVANSEVSTNSTSYVRVTSGAITLTTGHVYSVRYKASGGTAAWTFISAKIIALQDSPTLTNIRNQIFCIGAVSTTNTSANKYPYGYGTFLYTSAAYDGTITTSAECYLYSNNASGVSYAELYDKTDGTSENIGNVSGTTPTRVSASVTLTNGHSYYFRLWSNNSSYTASIRSGYIIIDQVNPTKTRVYATVNPVENDSITTTSTTAVSSVSFFYFNSSYFNTTFTTGWMANSYISGGTGTIGFLEQPSTQLDSFTTTSTDANYAPSIDAGSITLTNAKTYNITGKSSSASYTLRVSCARIYFDCLDVCGFIKTVNGLAKASVKTINGLAIASVKTWNGLA